MHSKIKVHLIFFIYILSNTSVFGGSSENSILIKDQLYNSKIALNLSQGKPLKYYSSDRIAQLMGNGIATLVDKKTQLNKLFSNKGAIFYNSNTDLNKKLNFMLKNNNLRNNLAKRGRNTYHKKFNSITVADFMISKIFNIQKKFNW